MRENQIFVEVTDNTGATGGFWLKSREMVQAVDNETLLQLIQHHNLDMHIVNVVVLERV